MKGQPEQSKVLPCCAREDEESMEQTRILICEDSQEGIFTGIYEAYERRCDPLRTKLQAGEEGNLCLFADYIRVVPDPGKAEKVARTLRRRFGTECYEQICLALSSRQEDKGQAVYRTVAEGLSGRVKGELMAHLGNPFVARTFALARAAGNESHHLLGFLRFEETKSGLLFARIRPKNNVLAHMMPHFADRFPGENFVILDEGRRLYGVHPAHGEWFLAVREEGAELPGPELSEGELQMQELFRFFCRKIMIKERENGALQRQLLPLRFRGCMTEFR